MSKEFAATRMKQRVENTTINELKSTVGYYNSITIKNADVKVDIKETEYMLLPVWMLNIKFKDKLYLFAMNGQTGKMVGNVPVDNGKLAVIWLIAFVISFIILSLGYFFFS